MATEPPQLRCGGFFVNAAILTKGRHGGPIHPTRTDPRGFFAVDEGVRPGFKDVTATVRIDSPAPADEIERLRASVDRHCPVLDILRCVTPVRTVVEQGSALLRPAA